MTPQRKMIDSETTAFDRLSMSLDSTNRIQRKNILIIDDEPGILDSIEELFNDTFDVFKAKDGKEGLDLFKSLPIDLIILDLKLPEMEGLDVLKHIREFSKTVPVIVLTAYSTIERAERCADLMVYGYIRKPFDPFDLLERVREILNENTNIGNIEINHSTYASVNELSSPIKQSIKFINNHFTKPIGSKDVAARILVSREYIGKKFKKELGHSINEYINKLRIEKSKQLLFKNRDIKLFQVSHQLGFKSESHFLRIFKKYTGMTPNAFKKSPIE
ncbi:MAG: response regulator [Thermodesulfobacteriota bacterium]